MSERPWWRRPSHWWYTAVIPLSLAASTATVAPSLELFTGLICDYQRSASGSTEGLYTPLARRSVLNVLPSYSSSMAQFSSSHVPSGFSSLNAGNGIPCASDPAVQAAVTTLVLIVTTVEGVLGSLTAAAWGSFSDRYGRTRVIGVNIGSLMLSDMILISAITWPQYIPGGHWAMVFGSFLMGALGGRIASLAGTNAYLADFTDAASRSRIFSFFLGLVYVGVAVGPSLASLVIQLTGQPITIFYVSASIQALIMLLNWLVIPESILPTQMKISRIKHATQKALKRQTHSVIGTLKDSLSFLRPLLVFFPHRVENGDTPAKGRARNWSLTWLAMGFFLDTMIVGAAPYWLQYAAGTFGWDSVKVGYWVSLLAVSKSLFLSLALPLIIKLFTPKSTVRLPISPSEPLSSVPSASPRSSSPRMRGHSHIPAFDLAVCRVSLVLQALSYVMMAALPAAGFIASPVVGAFGSGFTPALQSLTLELYMQRGGTESGELFGALSVVQALGTQIAGPAFFGLIYMKTVAILPQAMYFISVIVALLTLGMMCLVRLPKIYEIPIPDEVARLEQEEVLVDTVVSIPSVSGT
ncbi:MFS general substrate transporter [Artomyces pyxidatus]|uniref:MFS general substrate transporter n=1 Tax=Artomyces pyxidatus TaxID=48021 RepID=A0ACB8TCV4_9AGAM|nr:MFS general substrate transporter [Artomyces pyxidatus]